MHTKNVQTDEKALNIIKRKYPLHDKGNIFLYNTINVYKLPFHISIFNKTNFINLLLFVHYITIVD